MSENLQNDSLLQASTCVCLCNLIVYIIRECLIICGSHRESLILTKPNMIYKLMSESVLPGLEIYKMIVYTGLHIF